MGRLSAFFAADDSADNLDQVYIMTISVIVIISCIIIIIISSSIVSINT